MGLSCLCDLFNLNLPPKYLTYKYSTLVVGDSTQKFWRETIQSVRKDKASLTLSLIHLKPLIIYLKCFNSSSGIFHVCFAGSLPLRSKWPHPWGLDDKVWRLCSGPSVLPHITCYTFDSVSLTITSVLGSGLNSWKRADFFFSCRVPEERGLGKALIRRL